MSDTPTVDDTDAVSAQATDADDTTAVVSGDSSAGLPKAQLDPLSGNPSRPAGKDVGLELILDVPVTVTLELGRTTLTVRDLLQLNQGSVVEFDRRVGEPLDLLVNGTLLAHGELVVIDDGFGIRLTEVMSPSQRLEKLN
ncbi:MAG: flagellar motor switch protein FliN [Gammaproteobacteria bacterium]|nr:flagellar motor switch protein FliN [Gammaproteobacteria bacterium]NNF60049.1 flagellar motor switch protein FliN [Gammaproteobacteria bacterium]NNM19980.1 flagellar motor switch protein FliN [Gammaproteobacteria bacterium]